MEKAQNVEAENGEGIEGSKSLKDGSICGYESLHSLLSANLKPELFQEVSRMLLGVNSLSSEHDFDLQAFCFHSDKELLRAPRVVRVGLIQNSISLPTTAPFLDQKRAIFQKLKPIIEAAGSSGVNILCLQVSYEAWMMPFAFCTREKRWCEFAEPVDGESTRFLQDLALKYNMVIISSILERDVNHGETLWNTAVIIGNHGNIMASIGKTIYQESETSMRAHIIWKETQGIPFSRRLMERLLLIYVMGGTIL
ncbi:hypothetical protein SLA2020_264270 [Shorea laevis]